MSPIGLAKRNALKRRLESLGIRTGDVTESYVSSPGPGGLHVNRAATCVYLKHIPTGIEVKCSESRSQDLNRFLAWRRLSDRYDEVRNGTRSTKALQVARIRRRKKKQRARARRKYQGDV